MSVAYSVFDPFLKQNVKPYVMLFQEMGKKGCVEEGGGVGGDKLVSGKG